MENNKLSEKVALSEDRIPKPFSQNVYKNGKLYTTVNSCVTCSIVKVVEVLYAIKNGYYTELSKGYAYVKHSGTSANGTAHQIVLKSMLDKGIGSVPFKMCTDYTEKPDICEIINSRDDLPLLDEEAKKWAIGTWEHVKGNNNKELKENIIRYIEAYNVPLIGELTLSKGVNHSVVITGCDDDYIYYHDHDKNGEECCAKYSKWKKSFFYISIPEEENEVHKKFKDVENDRWSKKYIDKVCEEGIMNGVSEDTFAPGEPLTREQAAALICRLKYGME